MSFDLTPLPYGYDDLAPHISRETLEYHHGKHHAAYVNKLNLLTKGSPLENLSREELIRTTDGAIFNNAAQDWNHIFYWHCLSPNGGGGPTGALLDAINERFRSFDTFKEHFTELALDTFGSGWAWLILTNEGRLALKSTPNAGNPMIDNHVPLLVCDVWEHAYYIDYRNARPKYVAAFWELVNWEFVASNLSEAV